MNNLVCYITLKQPDGTVRAHLVDKSSFTIGRSQNADLPTLTPSVSREHVRIDIQGDKIVLTDLGSANGTTLNGEAIPPQTPYSVDEDTVVQLGSSHETYHFSLLTRPQEMKKLEELRGDLQKNMGLLIKEVEVMTREDLERKLLRIQQQGQAEAQEILRKAKDESQRITTSAVEEAHSVRASAQADATEILEKATIQTNEMRLSATREIQSSLEAAHKEANQIRHSAHLESDALLKEAQLTVRKQQAEMDAKLEAFTDTAQHRSMEIVRDAEKRGGEVVASSLKQAREIMSQAQAEAEEVRRSAQAELQETAARARQRADSLMVSAQKDIEDRVRRRTEEHEAVLSEKRKELEGQLERERSRVIAEAKRLAIEEQKSVVDSYAEDIEAKRSALRKIDAEVLDASSKKSKLLTEVESLNKELMSLQSEMVMVSQESDQLQKLVDEKNEILQKLETAEICTAELEAKSRMLETSIKTLESELVFRKEKGQEEHESFIKTLLIQRQKTEQEIEVDINKKRLAMLQAIEAQHQQEEKRIQNMRKHQVTEIARAVELKVADVVTKETGLTEIGALSQKVFDVVTQELSKQTTMVEVQTTQQLERVSHKQTQRLQQLKIAGIVAGFLTLVSLLVFRKEVGEWYLQQATSNPGKEYSEKRKLNAAFTPSQTDEFYSSYTDNVIFRRGYVEQKTDAKVIAEWTKSLLDAEFLTRHGLSEEDIIYFVSAEKTMISNLYKDREVIDRTRATKDIARMKEQEDKEIQRLIGFVKNETNFRLIRQKERQFLSRLRLPAGN